MLLRTGVPPLLAFLLCSLLPQTLPAEGPSREIRDFWFNGAEINRYALTQARYGREHPGHAELIFVTEPFLTDRQVKHEFGPGPSVDVLKVNALRTFNTGIYSYRTMTSTFSPIDLERFPHALKSTNSVQDWCGQTFQQVNRTDDGWSAQLRSYFQRDGDQDLELPDAWFEDELWTLLRLDPERLPTGELRMIPGALYTRFAHRPIAPAAAMARLETHDELYVYRVDYPELGRRLEIRFDREFPHILREWEEGDSESDAVTRAVLKKRVMQSIYWEENRPQDRRKRKALGLEPIPD